MPVFAIIVSIYDERLFINVLFWEKPIVAVFDQNIDKKWRLIINCSIVSQTMVLLIDLTYLQTLVNARKNRFFFQGLFYLNSDNFLSFCFLDTFRTTFFCI